MLQRRSQDTRYFLCQNHQTRTQRIRLGWTVANRDSALRPGIGNRGHLVLQLGSRREWCLLGRMLLRDGRMQWRFHAPTFWDGNISTSTSHAEKPTVSMRALLKKLKMQIFFMNNEERDLLIRQISKSQITDGMCVNTFQQDRQTDRQNGNRISVQESQIGNCSSRLTHNTMLIKY